MILTCEMCKDDDKFVMRGALKNFKQTNLDLQNWCCGSCGKFTFMQLHAPNGKSFIIGKIYEHDDIYISLFYDNLGKEIYEVALTKKVSAINLIIKPGCEFFDINPVNPDKKILDILINKLDTYETFQ